MSDCIINVGCGHWYPKGTARLERSLIHHGWHGDILTWKDSLPPGSPTHEEVPYAMKVYAFQHAIEQGYENIMWLDSSVWCVKQPTAHMQAMNRDGYYMVHCGFTCDQWTNDSCLAYFGITREEAKVMPMLSSGILGLNIRTEVGREFFWKWKNAMLAGAFNGSWSDHRHDQSCASIIAYQLGMKLHPEQTLDYYYAPNMPETVEFALAGM